MTATLTSPTAAAANTAADAVTNTAADAAPAAPTQGATRAERALAVGLWAVTGAALAFGMVATLAKAAGLFAG